MNNTGLPRLCGAGLHVALSLLRTALSLLDWLDGMGLYVHAPLQVPASTGAKPFILLSGDDSGVADLLVPSQRFNNSDWAYDRTRVANVSDTKVGWLVAAVVPGCRVIGARACVRCLLSRRLFSLG